MGFQIKIHGADPLAKALKELSPQVQRKLLRPALQSASSIVNKQAKALVPVDTGLLRRSIGVKVVPQSKHRIPGAVIVDVGPRTGFRKEINGKMRDPTKYAHLVEYGTRFQPARPFLRPAFDASKEAMEAVIRAKLGSGIEQLAKRA